MSQNMDNMNSSGDSNTGSSDDPLAVNGSLRMEEFPDLYEDENEVDDDDEDGSELNESAGALPRPPTKPNVPIEDETICPVCIQKGVYHIWPRL